MNENESSVNVEILSTNQVASIRTMTHREAKRVIHLRENLAKQCLMQLASFARIEECFFLS